MSISAYVKIGALLRTGSDTVTAVDWLLDSDPAIRWQVMRDLTHEPADVVAAERSRVTSEGWGARLLALQGADGYWAGGSLFPEWTSTTHTLLLLRYMGLDPTSAQARRAIALVRDNVKWDHAGQDYFAGEVEPCINGKAVAIGSYFGQEVSGIVDRLLSEQLSDGGWNCEAERGSTRSSFNTTIDVLEGLLQYERAVGASPGLTAARRKGEAYLLDRRMFRRLSTGAVVDRDWLQFSFPPRYLYDVLRGLDHLRSAGVEPDVRVAEAIDLVKSKRSEDGRWPLENPHPGAVYFDMDQGEGNPSRWNTLRAMRVLDWYEHGPVR
jgi:hypothetical protein